MDRQDQFLRELKQLFWENGINPDIYQLERLAHYANLLFEKNKEVNLISRKDVDNLAENHIFLSSILSSYLPEKTVHFLDIGTGGGLPGIPLSILNPMLSGVLVDSTSKKVNAVQEFISKLQLHNAIAENFRVESDEFKEKYANYFDLIVSRATVPLIILMRYALPLIKERAFIIAAKGGQLNDEFKTAKMKYKSHIKKSTIYELAYKPSNTKNQKGKKLIVLEITK